MGFVVSCSPGSSVIINGVDVCKASSTVDKKTEAKALEALKQRFPGVTFSGPASDVRIDDRTTIARGARVNLDGLTLKGAKIGSNAEIGDAVTIVNSMVDGSVSGNADVTNSTVKQGASVKGNATVEGSTLEARSSVRGNATVRQSHLAAGAKVTGNATAIRMDLGSDSEISGNAHATGFTVPQGLEIAAGRHDGAYDAKATKETGGTITVNGSSFIVTGNTGSVVIRGGVNIRSNTGK